METFIYLHLKRGTYKKMIKFGSVRIKV